MNRFEKIIDVGFNRYELHVSESYEVVFKLVRGVYKTGGKIKLTDEFCDDTSPIEIFGVKNSITAIRRIVKEFKNYVYENNPPMISFGAIEPSRRKLYLRVCADVEKEGKYTLVHSENGYFLLLRNL